jgi:hypothetical protein
VPTRTEIVTFHDPPVRPGESPWVPSAGPQVGVQVVDPDLPGRSGTPTWPRGSGPLSGGGRSTSDSPELVKHRIFRDWLRGSPADRDLYAGAKREAADATNALGEHSMQYNARKTRVVREIYRRALIAAGLLDE